MESSGERVHQIVFRRHGNISLVSCRCRRQPPMSLVENRKGSGRERLNPIGESGAWEHAVSLYNKAENHYAPFGEVDRLGLKVHRRERA